MSSRQKSPITRPMRRRLTSQTRPYRAQKSSRTIVNGGSTSSPCSSVSKKLEALKNIIPSHNGGREADQLFQETADYIVLLKTQVLILQRLVDFYGSNQTQNAVW